MTAGKDETEKNAQAVNRLNLQLDRAVSAGRAGAESAELLRKQIAWLTGEYEKGEAGVSDFYAGISAMGGVVIPLTGELEGLGSAASEVSQYFNEMTAQMMFNKLAATMDVDAAMALGEAMGLVNSETVFLSGEIEGLNAKYETNGQKGLQAAEMTKEYYQEVATLLGLIEGAKSKTIALTVRTFLDDQQGLFGQGPNNGYIGLSEGNRAIGGPVQAGSPYVVGEVGPELFVPNTSGTIIPNNKLSGGGSAGGVTNIYFTYAPALSLSDRAEFEGRVIPVMKRLMAKAG